MKFLYFSVATGQYYKNARGIDMKNVQRIEFHAGSKEELFSGFSGDFPYIASRAELDKYIGRFVPWHWHKAVELFTWKAAALNTTHPEEKYCFLPEAAAW